MIIVGDCLDVMRACASDTYDCICTDPPYGLQFMGKEWDRGVPGVEYWREALRVAKPGAWLTASSARYSPAPSASRRSAQRLSDSAMSRASSEFIATHVTGVLKYMKILPFLIPMAVLSSP
jgi:23S rRNA G2069 N7-methylase RlmK/C1962 C5-methylase RlmI